MSPYAASIIVVLRKSKPGAPLAETKTSDRLHRIEETNSKVQTTQAELNSSLPLIETSKIYHIWSKLKGVKYFTILDIRSGYHHIFIHLESRPKTALLVCMENFNGKE